MAKQRHPNTPTGNKGVTALCDYCDHNDLIFQAEPREDYGVDCYVEVQIGTEPQNFIVAVQVKSGPSYRKKKSDCEFSIRTRRDDVIYWLAANIPVLFVYFDIDANELYFKHIQRSFNDSANLEKCTKLIFSITDKASDGRLAHYVQHLALGAPNMLHRLEVVGGLAAFMHGDTRVPLLPTTSTQRISFSQLRNTQDPNGPTGLPQHNQLLGYSNNGEWVCEAQFDGSGAADGFRVSYRFENILEHTHFEIPLVASTDPELSPFEEESFDHVIYNATLDHLEYIADLLDIRQPVILLEDDSSLGAGAAQQSVGVSFGKRDFAIEIRQQDARDIMLLVERSFFPPREAPLLLQRTELAWLPPPPMTGEGKGWLESLEVARRFKRASAVWCNTNATMLSVAVVTNEENDCWGSPAIHIAHFPLSELRLACTNALR